MLFTILKHKLVELYPGQRRGTTGSNETAAPQQRGTRQPVPVPAQEDQEDPGSEELLSSEEVAQELALLDILNFESDMDPAKKTKHQKGKKEKNGKR